MHTKATWIHFIKAKYGEEVVLAIVLDKRLLQQTPRQLSPINFAIKGNSNQAMYYALITRSYSAKAKSKTIKSTKEVNNLKHSIFITSKGKQFKDQLLSST